MIRGRGIHNICQRKEDHLNVLLEYFVHYTLDYKILVGLFFELFSIFMSNTFAFKCLILEKK